MAYTIKLMTVIQILYICKDFWNKIVTVENKTFYFYIVVYYGA